jgi:hypothetical protein
MVAAGIAGGCSRGLEETTDAATDARDLEVGLGTPPAGEMAVVCFGADPAPYQQYLSPDGGVSPGQCPSAQDFVPARGEACGYVSRGPVPASSLADLVDGGIGDAGTDCCFLVTRVCGV